MERIKLKELKNVDGISNSEMALEHLKKDLDLSQENVVLIGMNNKNKVIFTKLMFKGGINASIIDLKLVLRELLVNNCNGFIIGHNHPSGDLTPSKEDIDVTNKLKDASDLLEMRLLDHFIFDNNNYISFHDENLL